VGSEVVAAELREDEESLALGGLRYVEGPEQHAAGNFVGGGLREEEAVGVLVEGGEEGVFGVGVLHVSFAVVELEESVQGWEIGGGGAADE
jgi:hypothetical protein